MILKSPHTVSPPLSTRQPSTTSAAAKLRPSSRSCRYNQASSSALYSLHSHGYNRLLAADIIIRNWTGPVVEALRADVPGLVLPAADQGEAAHPAAHHAAPRHGEGGHGGAALLLPHLSCHVVLSHDISYDICHMPTME